MTSPDMHLDTGALALSAMPEDEATAAEAHLATCDSCSAELSGFRETVAMLGSVAAEAPPASLRRAIMAQIAVTPQLPPLPAPDVEPASRAVEQPPSAIDEKPDNVVPLRPWYRRPASLVAAAVAALVIGGGSIVAINQMTGETDQVAQTPEQCVAQAPDKLQLTPEQGAGNATYAPSCGAVTLDITGLPDLPTDKTYQLWAIAGQTPRSLGVLPDASAGQQQLLTTTTQTGETVLAITTEPAGGSTEPTQPIIWQTTLDA